MVTRKRNLFWGRKWRTPDIGSGIFVFCVHLLALFAPFTFTWHAFFVGCGKIVLCGLFGITLSYHRNLAHQSFKLPKWLEYIFAYIGVLAIQIHTLPPTGSGLVIWDGSIDSGYMIEKGASTMFSYHGTFFVNSACHIWGYQTWDTGDLSKNNWWVALITFGEGWHNNHHAFENSARHGLDRWEIDICWYAIRFLEAVGLATNVKLPTKAQKLKKSFAASE
ncbi:hypothetical protein OSB04_014928 [Centaurea solstitialis]|uniref:Fatty acid desaturase domain-containing protein n=1 Tax=Centaurea solstitialis TaxID=347529 RepID=A0AA38THY2_9ASTR|nr:hypothetical protein OSB04_014928 [Centaurea solstitialis]